MFPFLKKGKKTVIAASPVKGKVISLEEVKDPVFSGKIMGDGFAVEPEEETVTAPVEGVIVTIPDSRHAFGMKTKEGVEVLVHIGLDTVKLGGEGFTVLAEEGSQVQAGTPVIRFDSKLLREKNMDQTIMTIITGGYDKPIHPEKLGETVEAGEPIIVD